MKKKGLAANIPVWIFVIVTTALVLFLLASDLNAQIAESTPNYACKLSVSIAARTGGILDFECPEREIAITESDIEKNRHLKKIAEPMADAWFIFNEGDGDAFQKELTGLGNIACKLFAAIKFEDDVRVSSVGGVHEYLKRTERAGTGMKYSKYLYDGIDGWADLVADELDTTETYYVLYQAYGDSVITIPWISSLKASTNSTVHLIRAGRIDEMGCDFVLK